MWRGWYLHPVGIVGKLPSFSVGNGDHGLRAGVGIVAVLFSVHLP